MRSRRDPLSYVLIVVAFLAVGGFGCRRDPAPAALAEIPLIRICVLPDLDSLPMVIASEEGWFRDAGVTVELVRAASAVERDQLLQAGQVDALVTDPVALALYNRAGVRVLAVRHSVLPAVGRPQFRLLASAGGSIRDIGDLKAVPVAVSEGTVIEYACAKTLLACGLRDADIQTVSVPGIPARMGMLRDGKIQAAVLPEPLASLAILDGARPLADEVDQTPFVCSLIAFSKAYCEAHPGAVQAFSAVMDRACLSINRDPAACRAVALEKKLLPPALAESFQLPEFPLGSNLAPAVYEQAVAWLVAGKRISGSAPFEAVRYVSLDRCVLERAMVE